MFRIETQHALRALTALAGDDRPRILEDLSTESRVPGPMLAKVLHRLAGHGLVRGRPGRGGGYRLARPAGEIVLRAVVEAVEGADFGGYCLFGLPDCSEDEPCPLHSAWKEIRGRVFDLLDRHTLADLASGSVRLASVNAAAAIGDGRGGPEE